MTFCFFLASFFFFCCSYLYLPKSRIFTTGGSAFGLISKRSRPTEKARCTASRAVITPCISPSWSISRTWGERMSSFTRGPSRVGCAGCGGLAMGRSCRRCWVCGGSSPVAGLHSFASLTDPGGIDQAGGRYMTPIRAHAKGFVPDSAPAAPEEADPQRRACGARARRPGPHMVRQKAKSTAERAEHAEHAEI